MYCGISTGRACKPSCASRQNDAERARVIVDELGRGTSTQDGLAIAIAIGEALVKSHVSVSMPGQGMDVGSLTKFYRHWCGLSHTSPS